ncbi:unnamed protein product [Bubo scandiacus]
MFAEQGGPAWGRLQPGVLPWGGGEGTPGVLGLRTLGVVVPAGWVSPSLRWPLASGVSESIIPGMTRGVGGAAPRRGPGRVGGGRWVSSGTRTRRWWYPAGCRGPSSGLCCGPGATEPPLCWEVAAPEQVLQGRTPPPRSARPRSAGGSVPAAPAGAHESPVTRADPVVQIEGNPHCCFFNFSPKIMFTKVVKAQLWVYLRPVQHTSTVYLQILRLKPVTEEGSRHIRIRSLKIDLNSRIGHWQSIDFKHVLQNWFKQPQNNWGIEINAFDPNGNDLAVTSLGPGAEGLHPFMELRVLENNKRSRRNLGLDCDEHSTESRCCRYPLTVDFEAFGWDWIIAPKRYKANYCSGQCEYMFMQKYPHTHLVQQANPRGSAGPCCTPTKMSPINMLYFNDKQQIIYGKIPGMVVDRCGCS